MTAKDLRAALLQEAVQGKLVPQIASEGNARDLLNEIENSRHAELDSASVKNRKKPLDERRKTLRKKTAAFRHCEERSRIRHCEERSDEAISSSSLTIPDDEKPFDIPQSWCWCRLGEICTKITDGTHKTPKYVTKGIPFLSVKNLSSGKMDFSNVKYITPEEHKELYARCNPEKGDMLLTKVGTTGIPVLNDSDIEFSLFVSVALLKFPHQFIDEKYFLYLLQSPLVQTQAKENTKGVGNKNWVMEAISNTVLVLPPLAEQKRIVAALEKILPLVEEYGKKEEVLAKLNADISALAKKAVLQEAVQGKLVPQIESEGNARDFLNEIENSRHAELDSASVKNRKKPLDERRKTLRKKTAASRHCEERSDEAISSSSLTIPDDEKPFDIPQNWCWCRLGEIIDTNIGLTYSPSDIVKENGTPVLRSNNIQNGKIDLNKLVYVSKKIPDKCISKKGDLLICARNGSRALVGKCALIESDGMAFGAFMAIIRSKFNPYIMYFLNSPIYRSRLDGVNTTTINQITQDNLKETMIPLPPLAEQKRIVAALEKILPLCEKLGK